MTMLHLAPPQRSVLAFPAPLWRETRQQLLADAPLESACFILARPVLTPAGGHRLVVHAVEELAASEYADRTPYSIQVRPTTIDRIANRARAEGSSIILAHSHPFGDPKPSPRDRAGEADLVPFFSRRVPGVPHGRLIVSPAAFHGALFDGVTEPVLDVVEVGADVLDLRQDSRAVESHDRFDRQVRAFGQDGQRLLQRLTVGIVGLGGTGSVVAQQLAHLGVGSLVLMDPDRLDESNLNRVVGARPEHVGRPKIDVAGEMITAVNETAIVVRHELDVRDAKSARILLDVDVVFCCTDTHGSRAVISQLAHQYLIPAIDLGVVIRSDGNGEISHIVGRVQMVAPGLPCLVCTATIDSEEVRRDLLTEEARRRDPYITGEAVAQPAVISINSTTASNAISMMLSAFLGIPVGARHQQLLIHQGRMNRVSSEPAPGCPVCSERGAALRGDSWPGPGRPS